MAIGRLTGFPVLPDNPNAGELTGRSGTEYGDFVTPNPERFALPGEETVSFVPDTSGYEGEIERRRDLPQLRPGQLPQQLSPTLPHPRLIAEAEEGDDHINNPLDFIHLDAMEHSPYGGLREAAELGRQIVAADRERRGFPTTNKKDARFLLRGQFDGLKLDIIRGELPELRSFFSKRPGASMSPRELIQLQEWVQLLEGNFKPAAIPNAPPTPLQEAAAEVEQEVQQVERDSSEARKVAAGESSLGSHISHYEGENKPPEKPPDPPPIDTGEKRALDEVRRQERENRQHDARVRDANLGDKVEKPKDPATLERDRLQERADAAANRPFTNVDPVNTIPIKADGLAFTPPNLLGKNPSSRPKPWWSTKTSVDYTKDPFIRVDSLPNGSPEKRLAQFILGTGMMGGLGLRGIDGELCATDMRFFLDEQQHGMDPMMQKSWVNLWKQLDYPRSHEVGDPREEPGPEVIDWYRAHHNPAADAARLAQEKTQQMAETQAMPQPGSLPVEGKESRGLLGRFRRPKTGAA